MDKEEVIRELKHSKDGFTVSELSSKMKVSRHTVANVFAYLEGAGKISVRKAGMAKIYHWKK